MFLKSWKIFQIRHYCLPISRNIFPTELIPAAHYFVIILSSWCDVRYCFTDLGFTRPTMQFGLDTSRASGFVLWKGHIKVLEVSCKSSYHTLGSNQPCFRCLHQRKLRGLGDSLAQASPSSVEWITWFISHSILQITELSVGFECAPIKARWEMKHCKTFPTFGRNCCPS